MNELQSRTFRAYKKQHGITPVKLLHIQCLLSSSELPSCEEVQAPVGRHPSGNVKINFGQVNWEAFLKEPFVGDCVVCLLLKLQNALVGNEDNKLVLYAHV